MSAVTAAGTRLPGKVGLRTDDKRGGWIAHQRWWATDGKAYRTQAWGPTKTLARQELDVAITEKKASLESARRQETLAAAASERGIPVNDSMAALFVRWQDWRREYEALSPSSLRSYRETWSGRLSRTPVETGGAPLGSLGIDDLELRHITNICAAISKSGVKVRAQHDLLRAMLSWVFRQDLRVDGRDMSQYVPSTPGQKSTAQRAITREEHLAMLRLIEQDTCRQRRLLDALRDVLICEWDLGIRIGELLALQYQDFVLDEDIPRVWVNATIIREETEYRAERRKAGAPGIWLRTSPAVVAVVESRRASAKHNADTDFVFAARTGRHTQACNLRRKWRDLIAAQPDRGLDGLSFHAYKRAMATDAEAMFSEAGLDAAAELTGTTKNVIRQHYVKVRGLRVLDPTTVRITGGTPGDDD